MDKINQIVIITIFFALLATSCEGRAKPDLSNYEGVRSEVLRQLLPKPTCCPDGTICAIPPGVCCVGTIAKDGLPFFEFLARSGVRIKGAKEDYSVEVLSIFFKTLRAYSKYSGGRDTVTFTVAGVDITLGIAGLDHNKLAFNTTRRTFIKTQHDSGWIEGPQFPPNTYFNSNISRCSSDVPK